MVRQGIGADFSVSADAPLQRDSASVGMTYSQTPTVVLSPLAGEAFVRKLILPAVAGSAFALAAIGWRLRGC